MNWQSLFYLTLPVGLVAIAAAWRLKRVRIQETAPLDLWGAVLLAAALVSLSLALTDARSHTASTGFVEQWSYQASMLALTALFTVLFVTAEKRAVRPIIELRFMMHGPFAWAIVANAVLHMTMMSSVFLIPFLTTNGRGFQPFQAAAVLLAVLIANIPSPPLSGWLFDRTRWRLLAPLSIAVVGICLALMSLFATTAPWLALLALSAAVGTGSGFFQTPNNAQIMTYVPVDLRGFAAGMIETSRQLGHTLGVAISGAILTAVVATIAEPSAAYLAGFRQAALVAALMAVVGVAAALIQARQPQRQLVEEGA